jgi:hypothetical protein
VLRHEIKDLVKKQSKTDELLQVYVKLQSRPTERVSALELQQRKCQSCENKLQYIGFLMQVPKWMMCIPSEGNP